MSALPLLSKNFDEFGRSNVKTVIYRDHRPIKKSTRITKGKIPATEGIRAEDLAVSQKDEYFEFDQDIFFMTAATGINTLTRAPEYVSQYDDELDVLLVNNLNKLQLEKLTPVQRIIVPLISGKCDRRHDVICCARANTGKSLGYLIGAINKVIKAYRTLSNREFVESRNISVLIMVDNNITAEYIYKCANLLTVNTPVKIATAIGNFNRTDESAYFEKMGGADIYIATLGRFIDYLKINPNRIKGVNLLIFDNAEKFIDDEGWLDAISLLRQKSTIEGPYQTVCLSTGFDDRSFENFKKFIDLDYWFIDIASLGKVGKVPQTFIDIANKDRTEETMKLLMARSTGNRYPKTIIFCNSKEVATMLSHRLRLDHKIPHNFRPYAAYLHGGTFDSNTVLNAFCTERGKGVDTLGDDSVSIDVVVGCDGLAAINTKVELVINFDFPASLCNYAQRIGRLQRQGDQGIQGDAFTLLDSQKIRRYPERVEKTIRNVLQAAHKVNARIPDSLEIFAEDF
uniref:ATP-dependent RNA helicase n=1 Tax=Panagrolaimus sp. ES5 TaxID=591445 RepID=A0AC34GWE4_9BILA